MILIPTFFLLGALRPVRLDGRKRKVCEGLKACCSYSKTSDFFSNADDSISAISSACFSNKTETEMKKDSLQTHKHDYSALNFDLPHPRYISAVPP